MGLTRGKIFDKEPSANTSIAAATVLLWLYLGLSSSKPTRVHIEKYHPRLFHFHSVLGIDEPSKACNVGSSVTTKRGRSFRITGLFAKFDERSEFFCLLRVRLKCVRVLQIIALVTRACVYTTESPLR